MADDRRVVLVGEAPSRVLPRPEYALTGASGRRLASLAGLSIEAYLRRTDRRNLFCDPVVGAWDAQAAKASADRMADDLGGRRVVLLGARVAAAFNMAEVGSYQWTRVMHRTGTDGLVAFWIARLPHPSGRNRALNDPAEQRALGFFVREALTARPDALTVPRW